MRGFAKPGSLVGAVALAGAVVLLWPNAPQAAAATGTFTYTDATGVSKTSANPPDDSCIPLTGSGEVANNTGVPVGFYKTKDCKQRVAVVNTSDSGKVPQYASIMFSQDNKPEQRGHSGGGRGSSHSGRGDRDRGSSGGSGGLGGLLGG
jgi:hypothetical protein